MKRKPSQLAYLLTVILLLGSSASFAQTPQPLGDTFPVNATSALDQSTPEVATDFDGTFISVWTSDGQDGSGTGIFAQVFDEDGEEVGPEFQVNDTTAGDQTDPAVSMSDDEAFAIVWVGPDADGTGIFLRIFDEKRATTMADIPVNTVTDGIQSNPDVALAEDEQVLVVWQSPDGDGEGIVGRFFDFEGVPLSVEFPIATSTSGDQTAPAAEDVDEDGSFVVAWEGLDAQGRGIFAQRVEGSGALLGREISVNTTTAGDQIRPEIGVQTNDDEELDNGFVIVWEGPDDSGSGVFAQFFDEDGNPAGGEIQVPTDVTGDQFDPEVSIDDEGEFVITWLDTQLPSTADGLRLPMLGDATGLKGSPILIRGRRFTSTGSARTGQDAFPIAIGVVENPVVASEANGDFVVVWQDADDGSGSGIFGQRFGVTAGIFQDGFESGSTILWFLAKP